MKFSSIITSILAFAGCQTTQSIQTPKTFTVTEKTVQIVGYATETIMAVPLKQLASSPKDKPVTIYIYSMGGDPRVGAKIIEEMQGRTTICYADGAGGTAFTILQACTVRIISEDAILGQVVAKFNSVMVDEDTKDNILDAEKDAHEIEAIRLKKDLPAYEESLTGGLLLVGSQDIMDEKAADAVMKLSCLKEYKTNTILRFINGNGEKFPLVMSVCPTGRVLFSKVSASEAAIVLGIPLLPANKD
jgi:ATP-dependent protease ClpP protease subunit